MKPSQKVTPLTENNPWDWMVGDAQTKTSQDSIESWDVRWQFQICSQFPMPTVHISVIASVPPLADAKGLINRLSRWQAIAGESYGNFASGFAL
jgi:hypothetical protein